MADQPGYVSAIRAAGADPAAPASIFEGRVRSWGETLDRAARIAGGLQELGVRPGDRVAVLSPNSDDYLALYLAIPWAGAVLVPLNCRWSQAENRFAIADCRPSLIFVSDDMAEANAALLADSDMPPLVSLGGPRPGWRTLDNLLAGDPAEDAGRSGDDLLAIFYTGGTTGRSKGVMLSHAGFTANCRAMRESGLFPDDCRALIVPPLFHLAAAAALTMTMLAGGTAVIGKAFDPAATLDLIAEAGVTDALLVPTMIQMMLDAPGFDPAKLNQMRSIMYGASPMQEATLDRVMAAAPHIDFFQAYGMTEVSCTATLLAPEYHRGEHRAAGRHRGAGRPMPIAEIRIADEADTPLPAGRGRRDPRPRRRRDARLLEPARADRRNAARRLDAHRRWRADRRSRHPLCGRPAEGHDRIGRREYLFGRSRKRAGAAPGVAQVAVIGVPDPRWGERVHAVVVPRAGAELTEEALVAHCRELIAGYKCPRSIEFRTALPLSAAGKDAEGRTAQTLLGRTWSQCRLTVHLGSMTN
jgi:long-chain acyl-CoA synthetase